jgi:glycosyltransferase involved in cell wall biosynthesis
MTSGARITTVIPTFGRRALLERAVASVLEQGRSDVSVRVFDNASPDDTGAVMRKLAAADPRVLYQCHSTNIGAIANFSFALSAVDTEFFSILSDDDYLLPGFYEHALRALDDDPTSMFWAGCTLHVDESDRVVEARVETWRRHGRFDGEEGVLAMTGGRAPAWTGIVFRHAVLERLGLPDQEARGPSDMDFVLRAAAHSPFIVSDYPAAVFTLNATSFSATQPLSSFWPGWVRMIENVRGWSALDVKGRERVALALERDARRMLFRRGVFAMVTGRRDFATDAAKALRGTRGGQFFGWALAGGLMAARIPIVVRTFARLYRALEMRLMRQRVELQHRYEHLLRPLGPTERR